MAPPKKMTLHEFFTDESFGGSWADDDIDLASISVPIEKNRPFGSDHHSSGFNYNSGSFIGGPSGDNGPPYIIKLLHLPVTCNDGFVDDLFQSRYTPYIKFKIVADPISNILETHVIKKVAFVELTNYDDYAKALKWSDLYYKENRRVIVEPADFRDFQNCISFNQEHEQEIEEIVEDFIAGKNQENQHGNQHRRGGLAGMPLPEPHELNAMGPGRRVPPITPPSRSNMPLNRFGKGPTAHSDSHSNNSVSSPPLSHPATQAQHSKPKSNPFGAARPVDVVAKEKELDETIESLHHNDPHHYPNPRSRRSSSTNTRRPSVNILKRPEAPKPVKPESASTIATNDSELSASKPPSTSPSLTQPKPNSMSLADILSAQGANSPVPSKGLRSTPVKQSPKAAVIKPVILRKKTQSNLSPMPTNPTASATTSTPTSPPLASGNLAKPLEHSDDKASQRVTEAEIENKLKQINDTLSKHSTSQTYESPNSVNSNIHTSADNQSNYLASSSDNSVGTAHIPRSPQKNLIEPTSSNRRSSSSSATSADSPAHGHVKPRIDLLSRTRIAEPNKSYSSSGERPNFKQHFNEMTKKANVTREGKNHVNRYNHHNKPQRHQAQGDNTVDHSADSTDQALTDSGIGSLSPPSVKPEPSYGRSFSPNRSTRYNNRQPRRTSQPADETLVSQDEGVRANGDHEIGQDTEEVIENVRALALRDENVRSYTRGRGRGRGNHRGHRGHNRGYGGYGRGSRGNFSNKETVPGAKEIS